MITFVEDRKGHDLRYAIDSSKVERELGWDRTYTFEDGICIKYEVKEETVCQYKKIVDKNGKLLCDNDIALYHNEEDGTGIGIIRDDYVEWISGTIAMSHLITPLFYLQCSSEWEIVGNTFDDKNYISREE